MNKRKRNKREIRKTINRRERNKSRKQKVESRK